MKSMAELYTKRRICIQCYGRLFRDDDGDFCINCGWRPPDDVPAAIREAVRKRNSDRMYREPSHGKIRL